MCAQTSFPPIAYEIGGRQPLSLSVFPVLQLRRSKNANAVYLNWGENMTNLPPIDNSQSNPHPDGDSWFFEEFCHFVKFLVRAFSFGRASNEDTEEMVQEVFVRLGKAIRENSFHPANNENNATERTWKARGWIRLTTRHVVSEYYRSSMRFPVTNVDFQELPTCEAGLSIAAQLDYCDAVQKCSEDEQLVLGRRDDGYSIKEIAQQLNISRSSVNRLFRSAKRQQAAFLAAYE
jgi:RNA polymerase sigma factor (sigma-70 family)